MCTTLDCILSAKSLKLISQVRRGFFWYFVLQKIIFQPSASVLSIRFQSNLTWSSVIDLFEDLSLHFLDWNSSQALDMLNEETTLNHPVIQCDTFHMLDFWWLTLYYSVITKTLNVNFTSKIRVYHS